MNEPTNPTRHIRDLKPKTKDEIAAMPPRMQIEHYLAKKKDSLAAMVPKTVNLDRLLKVATIAATTTPALMKCDVASLVASIGNCATLGLEPNTPLGHAYLVPFNTRRKNSNGEWEYVNSVQVIIGYRGYIDLARRSGQIVSLSAHEVCANDHFDYAYGLIERLEHVPARTNRGDVVAFYAVAHLKGGGHCFEVLSREEVEAIRAESQGWQQAIKFKKQDGHIWHKYFVEMGRKTAIRRLAKYLPLSIDLANAMNVDGSRVNPEVAAETLNDPNTIDGDMTWLPDTDFETGETSPPAALADDPTDAFGEATQQQAAEYVRASKGEK